MSTINLGLLPAFVARCEALGLTAPKAIARALELVDVAHAHDVTPSGPVLGLSDDEARARVTEISIRRHSTGGMTTPGMTPGILEFEQQLAAEVRSAVMPDLEDLVASLQARFAEAAQPFVVAAQEFGFTSRTTSDQVMDLADEEASDAWRGAKRAWAAISPIVGLRIDMSKIFEVSPTREEMGWMILPRNLGSTPVNYSVAFAAGENWSLDGGYYIEGQTVGHLDWLALAAGGLRLNTPSEVAAKIAARPSPGIPSLEERLVTLAQDDAPRIV